MLLKLANSTKAPKAFKTSNYNNAPKTLNCNNARKTLNVYNAP